MGEPSQNHTWLCSVVFVDVVSYTRNLMDGQVAVKEYLDQEILRYLSECNSDDYILLDRKEFHDLLAAELSKPADRKAFLMQMHDL